MSILTIKELAKSLNMSKDLVLQILGRDDLVNNKIEISTKDGVVTGINKSQFINLLKTNRNLLGLANSSDLLDICKEKKFSIENEESFRKNLSDLAIAGRLLFIDVTEKENSKRRFRLFAKKETISYLQEQENLKQNVEKTDDLKSEDSVEKEFVTVFYKAIDTIKKQNAELRAEVDLLKTSFVKLEKSLEVSKAIDNANYAGMIKELKAIKDLGLLRAVDDRLTQDSGVIEDMSQSIDVNGNDNFNKKLSDPQKRMIRKISAKYPSLNSLSSANN